MSRWSSGGAFLVLAALLAMAFDLGFNCRATAGFVTDQSFAVPMLAEVYPHTYTDGLGYSVNAGWLNAAENKVDRTNTNDPRLAGIGFGGTNDFKIDLSSGSAPGAGPYTIDMAAGDAGGTQTIGFEVRDNTTVLITVPSQSVTGGSFLDATVTDIVASTTWTGTTVSKTFATTTCLVHQTGSNIFLAHFRLTVPAPPPPVVVANLPLVNMPPIGMVAA